MNVHQDFKILKFILKWTFKFYSPFLSPGESSLKHLLIADGKKRLTHTSSKEHLDEKGSLALELHLLRLFSLMIIYVEYYTWTTLCFYQKLLIKMFWDLAQTSLERQDIITLSYKLLTCACLHLSFLKI